MSLIGKQAPLFTSAAVLNGSEIVDNFSLNNFKGKYVVLIFYPKDFTFVCPTELHAFQNKIKDFHKKNAEIIAISTDTEQSHYSWLNTPKNKGGIQGVTYPIVSDVNKTISYDYNVLAGSLNIDDDKKIHVSGQLIAYRALFITDKNLIIRHQLINDFFLGRNINEAIRVIDSIQHFEENGNVCPANWKYGKKSIQPNHKSVSRYLSKK